MMLNLDHLTSIVIEEWMNEIIPNKMRQVHCYPCILAKIFAVMSMVYKDQVSFPLLLPLLVSLLG